MQPRRRFVDVVVMAPLGVAATLAAAMHRRRHVPTVPHDAAEPAPVVPERPSPGVTGPPLADLPIDGYDHLAASQVVDRLNALTAGELELVAEYERSRRHRQSVLAKIAQLQR